MHSQPVTFIKNVLTVAGTAVHDGCTKAVLHQDPASEASLFRVEPGGYISDHEHPDSWDLFIGVEGTGLIEFEDVNGSGSADVGVGSYAAVPPGVVHRVSGKGTSTFVFILLHAPWETYQLIKTGFEHGGD